MKENNVMYDGFEKCMKLSEFVTVLSNPKRMAILCILKTGKKNVKTISEILHIPQSSVSLHLCKLYHTNWVEKERKGKEVFYKIRSKKLIELLEELLEQLVIIKERR